MQYEKDFFNILERIAISLEKISNTFEKYMKYKEEEDRGYNPEVYNCVKCGKICFTNDGMCETAQLKELCNKCFKAY